MVTILEEVMDVIDSARSCVELVQEHYEAMNPLSGVLWSVQWQLSRATELLCIVEAGEIEPKKEVPTLLVTATRTDTETNHNDSTIIPEENPTMEKKSAKPDKKPAKKLTGKYGKAFRAWRDKGAGPSKIVELCDVNMETATKWVQEFVGLQK